MTKLHGLNGLTDLLNSFETPISTTPDDSQADDYSTSVVAVNAAPPVLTDVLYLTETGSSTPISVADINQGQLGDCFLLSSFGEMALLKPASISSMIHVNANGTQTVMLFEASNGKLPTWGTAAFKSVSETVTNVFPTNSVDNGAAQDVLNNQKEIWPQVMEKAVATLDGGYSGIANGGSPVIAMEELTGHAASFISPASLTLAALQSFVSAGDLLVMDTLSSGSLPNGLVNNHAYMFEGVTGTGSSAMVHLGNPWGFDQPTAIPIAQLSRGLAEVDIGHFS